MKIVIVLSSLLILFTTACVKPVEKDYENFHAAAPRSILIVPVVNHSLNVDAPDYFLSTISVPLAEQGYYVFPVNMIKRLLEDDGLADADLVHSSPVEKLASIFGADAVLFVKINRWDARYILLSTTVTVELEYEIKDGKTGMLLWHDLRQVHYTPSNNNSGNPLAGLIVNAIAAALEKAAPNYMPLAKQANQLAFTYPGPGIPPGPYLVKDKERVNPTISAL